MICKYFKTMLAFLSLMLLLGAITPVDNYSEEAVAPYCDSIFIEN